MMKPLALNPGEPILVRSPNWLGDAIMATSAIIRLKERWPKNPITILCQPKLAGLWGMQPLVSGVIPLQPSIFSNARLLRKKQFAAALVLPNSFRTAAEVFLAGIPVRIGYSVNARSCLLTNSKPPLHKEKTTCKKTRTEINRLANLSRDRGGADFKDHHIFYYLHLVELAGASSEPCAPTLTPPVILKQDGVVIGFNPGAEYGPAKRWPVENFITVGKLILAKSSARIVVFGGPADVPICDQVVKGINSSQITSLGGRTTLQDLAANFKNCDLLLTNDTGPMHLAAAVGTPVVALFGSTLSDLTSPGLPGDSAHTILQSTVGCSPCFWRECPIDFRCMKQFNPEQVANIIASRLNLPL